MLCCDLCPTHLSGKHSLRAGAEEVPPFDLVQRPEARSSRRSADQRARLFEPNRIWESAFVHAHCYAAFFPFFAIGSPTAALNGRSPLLRVTLRASER